MRVPTIAVFLILALAPAAAWAAPNPPPAAILKLADDVAHAAQTDDSSGMANIFTSDAVVVDENAPFVWRGAGAGTAWWNVVDSVTKKIGMKNIKEANVRVTEFESAGSDAYMIQSMSIVGAAKGKPFAEPGTMTYAFHNDGGTWKISTMVWTTKPAGAAAAQPPAPIAKLVGSVAATANANDAGSLAKLYTADAAVTDEIPPFVWRGVGSGSAWWSAAQGWMKANNVSKPALKNGRFSEFVISGNAAYLIVPVTLTDLHGGKPSAESGAMTYTFTNAGPAWRISSQTWTTLP